MADSRATWTYLLFVGALFACGCARQPDAVTTGTTQGPSTRIVTGRVLNNEGKPFAEPLKITTTVASRDLQPLSRDLQALTDSDGRFRLLGISGRTESLELLIKVWSGDDDLYVRPVAYQNSHYKQAAIFVTLHPGNQPVDVGTWLAESLETRRKRINEVFGSYCNAASKGNSVLVPESVLQLPATRTLSVLQPRATRTLLLQWDSGSWGDSWSLHEPVRDDVAALCLRETREEVGAYGERGDVLGLGGPAENYYWHVVAILRNGRVLRNSFNMPAPRKAKGQRIGDLTIADTGQVERLNDLVNKWLEEDAGRVSRPDNR